jgi:salicylate hydroxylase
MAIEDACVLAAMVARHADDLTAALTAYQQIRAPRARAAVMGSRERARENHLASPWARLARDMKFALRQRLGGSGKKHDNTAFQVGWLYEYDVGKEAG